MIRICLSMATERKQNLEAEKVEKECDSEQAELNFTFEDPLADVILLVEGKRLYTSRSILALSSPVFRCMFSSGFLEKDKKEIELPGKAVKTVDEMLKFLHPAMNTELQAGDASALRLLPLAEEYQMPELMKKCTQTLQSKLTSETIAPNNVLVIKCLDAASHFGLDDLEELAIEKCTQNGELVKQVQRSESLPLEVKNKVYEKRLKLLEEENQQNKMTKEKLDAVKFRLKAIVNMHEDHCRCRIEMKLRSNLQRHCSYCARHWCSDHVSTDSYRNSYWFFCNHRIGYTVANDFLLKQFIESNDT